MKDYIVSEARVDCGFGMACGPVFGPVVAEAKFTEDDGSSFYVVLAEVEGCPNIYKCPMSTIDKHLSEDDDEEFWDKANSEYLEFSGEYEELFDALEDEDDLYRYLIYLVRCSWEDAEKFIEETNGKHLSEIDIPKSDVEDNDEYD